MEVDIEPNENHSFHVTSNISQLKKTRIDKSSLAEKKHDHATKLGGYTCEACSRSRQELKRQKKKATRNATLDFDTSLGITKKEIKQYPYDRQLYNPHGEKYVGHLQRQTIKRNLVKMIEEYSEVIPKSIRPVWRDASDIELEELLFRLEAGLPTDDVEREICSAL